MCSWPILRPTLPEDSHDQELPLSQPLTETDNPGGWEWLTGTMGMPHHLKEVIQAVADLKQTTFLYRLHRNHHCCTTIAAQAVQEWCNSGSWGDEQAGVIR
jgi:Tat protein secretion system quality control protein TatD with DNase activity